MCVDIEIRAVSIDDGGGVEIIIYDIDAENDGLSTRSVRGVFHAMDYFSAIGLLPEFLNAKEYLEDLPPPCSPPCDIPGHELLLEFVEKCHDVSNQPARNYQAWLNELTVRCRMALTIGKLRRKK